MIKISKTVTATTKQNEFAEIYNEVKDLIKDETYGLLDSIYNPFDYDYDVEFEYDHLIIKTNIWEMEIYYDGSYFNIAMVDGCGIDKDTLDQLEEISDAKDDIVDIVKKYINVA